MSLVQYTAIKGKKMRTQEATEGDIRLRRGPGIKEDKAGPCVESRARRLNVLEC